VCTCFKPGKLLIPIGSRTQVRYPLALATGEPWLEKRAFNELRKLSITVIYLWVLLSVFALRKFMWLGEILHAEKKAAGKALLYSTLWNAALFITVILMVCRLLEEALVEVWHGHSFAASFFEAVAVPEGYLGHYPACVCGVNSLLFCKGADRGFGQG